MIKMIYDPIMGVRYIIGEHKHLTETPSTVTPQDTKEFNHTHKNRIKLFRSKNYTKSK